jgi:CBS domain-containing protein
MSARGVRHLPVVDAKGLCGMVSIRDLLAHKVSEQQDTIAQMNPAGRAQTSLSTRIMR